MSGGKEKGKRRFVYSETLPKLESVQQLSDAKGKSKESNRRITVLNKLFMKNITDLMATDNFAKNVAGYGLQVSCVKVAPDFNSLNVYWLAQGDENDLKIEQILKSIAGPIRHELSQLRLMGEVPRVYFVRDRMFSKAIEVDSLLSKADFGEDFAPTDPTLFMKSNLALHTPLPEDVRMRILELEQNIEEDEFEEEELPEMRHDTFGLDHARIMQKIATSIDKSKAAWEKFEVNDEYILGKDVVSRDTSSIRMENEKVNKEEETRMEFIRFLERKQLSRDRERKKFNNLNPKEDEDEYLEEYEDIPDDDYFEDDDPKR